MAFLGRLATFRALSAIQYLTSQVTVEQSPEVSAPPLSDEQHMVIAVMGATGAGKSTLINLVSGSDLGIGHGLESCTSTVATSKAFRLDGRWVTLVDTPGFDDTNMTDRDILNLIAAFLGTTYASGKKLAGVIYLHRISDPRMGGISKRNFKMFRELCGDETLRNVIIVTTMWEKVSRGQGEAREKELMSQDSFFKPALEKGARLVRYYQNVRSARAIIRSLLKNDALPLRIQQELVDEAKDISQTAAGVELTKEFEEELKKKEEELKQVMEDVIKEKDDLSKQELEEAKDQLRQEILKIKHESESQASDYEQRKVAFEEMIRRRADEERKFKERIQDLENKLSEAFRSDLTGEIARLTREIEELKNSQQGGGGGGCRIQ